jgi:hypothetical protein
MLRDEMTSPEPPLRHLIPAFWGGSLGVLLVIAHVALDVFEVLPGCRLPLHPRSFNSGDPFVHTLSEFAICGSGGAMLFSLLADIRTRLTKKKRPQWAL